MERKNQNILVALIAVVIAVAVFSSFGMNLIPPNTATIAEMTPAPPATPEQSAPADGEGLKRVSVTPETVQDVVATLSRPESYSRQVEVRYAGAAGPVRSQMWVSGGWTRTDTAYPNGTVRHTLVGEGTLYYWYGDGAAYESAPADGKSADLDGPHIPTYEDVLSLDPEAITDAYYPAQADGVDCIYVAWTGENPEERGVYYISVEPGSLGLLAKAQVFEGEEEVLSMTALPNPTPDPPASAFLLPDGTDPKSGE